MDTELTMNAFQRRYFAWAAPHYARMSPPLRHEVECLDRWLYSRAGLRFWGGVAAAIGVAIVGLVGFGMPWGAAVPIGLAASGVVILTTLSAWLQPERYVPSRLAGFAVTFLVLAYLGAIGGFVVGEWFGHGVTSAGELLVRLGPLVRKATPAMLLLLATLLVLMGSVAAVRRFRMRKEVDALRRAQESEALARQLAEARLRLLQQQIQPHFIFNTLAAIQHWVDEADPRAGPMLRALTSFLRGSTELLGAERTTLAVEAETVRSYLSIMEGRLGDRLHSGIEIDGAAGQQAIPPGLLLTLVENAIEHGIAPAVRGGTIVIDARDDGRRWTLEVRNGGVGLAPGRTDGVGLANCRERLAHLFGRRATLALRSDGADTVAAVHIDRDATP